MNDLDVYIDNRAIDGFIKFFLIENCELKSCEECGYCREVAERVVEIKPENQKNVNLLHQEFLDKLTSGDIFKYYT